MGKKHLFVKAFASVFFTLSIFLITATKATAQQSPPTKTPATTENKNEDIANADVSITANVTAKELKFEVVPNPKVEFPGKPERKTLWESDRQNLPQSVEPGVTYRNIGIRLRIASRFADIDRIVAEALGEVPITDDAPKDNSVNSKTDSSNNQAVKKEVQTVKQDKPQ